VTRRVAYSERAPSELLRSFVVCSWTRDATLAGDAPTSDRILPDGCVDIIWDERSLFVAGPDTRPVLVDPVGQPTRYAGVRFRPGTAPAFLRVPSSELVDQRVPLDAIWDAAVTQRLTDRLASAASMRDAVSEMEHALTERLDGEVDRVAAAAISAIATDPAIRVAGIAARVGVTERTLHRRVRSAVGYGPKMLQRVARFRRFLALAPRDELGLAGLARVAGYADQAHLSRECVALAGLTPLELVRRSDVRLVQDGLTPPVAGCGVTVDPGARS
jgi:AraC-like DNA-binding protein